MPATTPVLPTNAGNINQVVPSRALKTNAPIPLDGTGDFGDGVAVTLTKVEPVTAQARLPGEIAGPALTVTVNVINRSGHSVDLGSLSVNLQDGSGTPANQLRSQSNPLGGSLAPAQQSAGTYVFSLPADRTSPASISVLYSTEAPVVLFVGNVR